MLTQEDQEKIEDYMRDEQLKSVDHLIYRDRAFQQALVMDAEAADSLLDSIDQIFA